MTDSIRTTVEWLLIIVAIIGYYVTYVHLKWWNLYKPSPLVRHLLLSSIAVDVSATILAVISTLGLLDIQLPSGVSLILVAFALFIALGVKVYRRIDLHALDHYGTDLEQRVETQDQREDRAFGNERRALEAEHLAEGYETENQQSDREIGDAKREAEGILQDNMNDADKK